MEERIIANSTAQHSTAQQVNHTFFSYAQFHIKAHIRFHD